MRQFADYWTATTKSRRALFLIAALLPLAGFAGCPPTERTNCQGSGCEDHDSDSSSGGYGGSPE